MTATGVQLMAKNRQLRPRERLGWFLREQYPGPGREKRLARDLDIAPRTARNLFEDHWPNDDTFEAILRRFGKNVWRAVCAPSIEPILAELTEREARLARELDALRSHREAVEGHLEGSSRRLAGSAEEDDEAQLSLFGETLQ